MHFNKAFFLLLFKMVKNIFSLKIFGFTEHIAEAPPLASCGLIRAKLSLSLINCSRE